MRIRVKTIIALVVMLSCSVTGIPASSGARADGIQKTYTVSSSGSGTPEVESLSKDETVYALLNEDGSVHSVYVVNHFKVPKDGIYLDYGNYERVESLTEGIKPQMEGDRILWDLKESYGNFYYKGVLPKAELPWLFSFEYFLDGNKVRAQDLAGKNGRVEISLEVTANESAQSFFREQFAIQIQIPVNLNHTTIISADGASQVITGQTNTLAYTVLPGSSGAFRLVMEVREFEMDSINIGISKVDFGEIIDIDNLGDGFSELNQGMEDWAGGAKSFKNGLDELASGVDELADGLHDLSEGSRDLSNGIASFSEGFRQFSASAEPITSGSESIRDGLSQIAANGDSILAGYQQLAEGIKAQLPSEAEKEQLRMLAQYAGAADSPYAQSGAMAQSMLEQIAGLEQLYQSLVMLNGGLSQYTGGVTALSQEYEGFDQGLFALTQGAGQLLKGITDIEEGSRQLSGGLARLDGGMKELNENMKALPGHAQELVDGSQAIKDGIDSASNAIAGMLGQDDKKEQNEEVISFVSPEKGVADSVQFIIRTPAISEPEEEKEMSVETASKKKGFWQKMIALFR